MESACSTVDATGSDQDQKLSGDGTEIDSGQLIFKKYRSKSLCFKCSESGEVTVPLNRGSSEKAVRIKNDTVTFKGTSSSIKSNSSSAKANCERCIQIESNIQTKKQQQCSVCKDYWGILLSVVSGLASTFGGIIVKHMKGFHPFSLATYRFQGVVFPALVIVLYYKFVRKEDVFKTVWPVTDKEKLRKFGFTIVRAVIGCLGLYLYFYAIKLMPLADAKIIGSCRPVFVTFVAYLWLGEPCGIFPVVASMVAVIGMGVLSKPPILTGQSHFDYDTLMGTGFATLSMLAATLSLVVLRYLRGVHVAVVTLAFGFWGTLLSFACSVAIERFDVPQTNEDWILIVCLAVAAFFSQTAITLAMKYEHAGAVVIVGTCDTIFAFILQYFLLGESPDIFRNDKNLIHNFRLPDIAEDVL
ncbi:Solute carrier family 35 member G1 [Orchesella cincta]|uniref:Solute carrier family 35 member G1 n=1 Tax=Orchesella cincta TaxID=48709 RepID=A0A1D2N6H1_ORCCI|nr:Solute carrier family 35 member G1 [Orchesella cincta]